MACRAEPRPEIHAAEGGVRTFEPAPSGITVVHLWGTWCPPCVRELPDLNSFVTEGAPEGVTLVVVSTGEPLSRARQFLQDNGYSMSTAGDPDGHFRSWLGASAVPTTVIMDPSGSILERKVGAAPWTSPSYRADLSRLAGEHSR